MLRSTFTSIKTLLFQVLVARCEHDAVVHGPTGELQFLTVKALNEWDSKAANGVEWRQKLDTQRGAVLANELRNNACKLAKWTVQVCECYAYLLLISIFQHIYNILNYMLCLFSGSISWFRPHQVWLCF